MLWHNYLFACVERRLHGKPGSGDIEGLQRYCAAVCSLLYCCPSVFSHVIALTLCVLPFTSYAVLLLYGMVLFPKSSCHVDIFGVAADLCYGL